MNSPSSASVPSPSLGDRTATSPSAPVAKQVVATVPLLAERLQVDYQRRKLGEVIIHKRVETRMLQVPVRHETLVIEQISPTGQQLVEVDFADREGEAAAMLAAPTSIRGEFTSPRVASQMLYELGKTLPHSCNIRVEIELADPALQTAYQAWLDGFIQNSQCQ